MLTPSESSQESWESWERDVIIGLDLAAAAGVDKASTIEKSQWINWAGIWLYQGT